MWWRMPVSKIRRAFLRSTRHGATALPQHAQQVGVVVGPMNSRYVGAKTRPERSGGQRFQGGRIRSQGAHDRADRAELAGKARRAVVREQNAATRGLATTGLATTGLATTGLATTGRATTATSRLASIGISQLSLVTRGNVPNRALSDRVGSPGARASSG